MVEAAAAKRRLPIETEAASIPFDKVLCHFDWHWSPSCRIAASNKRGTYQKSCHRHSSKSSIGEPCGLGNISTYHRTAGSTVHTTQVIPCPTSAMQMKHVYSVRTRRTNEGWERSFPTGSDEWPIPACISTLTKAKTQIPTCKASHLRRTTSPLNDHAHLNLASYANSVRVCVGFDVIIHWYKNRIYHYWNLKLQRLA